MAEQKLRTLCVMEILQARTDEEHILNASDLCRILKSEYGIHADRKTIYSEIDTLCRFGLDILQRKGKAPGYYVGSRNFELPELKLLVDAVQSAKFITEKKSEELIQKLEKLCSNSEAEQLQRQVFIYNRIKTGNETIYYNVDQIHTAIYRNRQIRFQYCEWNSRKELVFKKSGAFYQISPWALSWDDENYYLIGFDEAACLIKHYRVDKMQYLSISDAPRLGEEHFKNFDLASFAKKTFGMYGGYDEQVTLLCHNSLAGVVIDRFGQEVWMVPHDVEHFRAKVTVAVSRQFFGWVTGIGPCMEILGSEQVRREYEEYLEETLKVYR